MKWFVKWLLRPQWKALVTLHQDGTTETELVLTILGVPIGLYKGETYFPSQTVGEETTLRKPQKHEFGTSLHPI